MWNENDKRPVWQYLALTFGIAWFFEAIIILGEQLGILAGNSGKIIVTSIIFLGAGCAPAYAMLILMFKFKQVKGFKDFVRRIFHTENSKKTILVTLAFIPVLFIVNLLISKGFADNPWYYYLVVPFVLIAMIFGGGLEEIGWRGFLQPSLEKKLPTIIAVLLTGIIWVVWHLPLWSIKLANQVSFNFWSFAFSMIVLSFVLAAVYKLTKCVFACVIIHAWSNVLNGLFIGSPLVSLPGMRVILIYLLEIIVSIIIIQLAVKKSKPTLLADDNHFVR
jgi:membrane protease YdiL (CAAX protease family)